MAIADSRVYGVLTGQPDTMTHGTETVIPDYTGGVDSTPSAVFALGIASILILVGLKYLGFRFSFGVGVGGGG